MEEAVLAPLMSLILCVQGTVCQAHYACSFYLSFIQNQTLCLLGFTEEETEAKRDRFVSLI